MLNYKTAYCFEFFHVIDFKKIYQVGLAKGREVEIHQ